MTDWLDEIKTRAENMPRNHKQASIDRDRLIAEVEKLRYQCQALREAVKERDKTIARDCP